MTRAPPDRHDHRKVHDRDPDHWLYRFTPEEWLRSATAELAAAERALSTRQRRAGVTQARRAAGMAWNAVLVATSDETGYGRSYMEHLQALAREAAVPELVREAARTLLEAPLSQAIVPLGQLGHSGDTALARAADAILSCARERVTPTASS